MIDLHFKDGWSIKEIAKKFNADYSHIKELISLYIKRKKGIIQSMSRKGNCLDNSKMETFFSRLKNEIYYGVRYKNINELKNAIKEYICYYNNRRIQIGLGSLTPSEYRLNLKQHKR